MAVPKGFRKKVNIQEQPKPYEAREEFVKDVQENRTYLPVGIGYEDIDKEFIDTVTNEFKIELDGEVVPVIFLTQQRWVEFSKTWTMVDNKKTIKMPFITIVREPAVQPGTSLGNFKNAYGEPTYVYHKVERIQNNVPVVDVYKIPSPVQVDLSYDVRLFCNRMRDLNVFNSLIQKKYQSSEFYLFVKENPMPTELTNVGDESENTDYNKRRFYVQTFEITVKGYIMDENDFEVTPGITRSRITFK